MPPFLAAIANDGQPTDRRVKFDRGVDIATVDSDVRPARRHARKSYSGRQTLARHVGEHLAKAIEFPKRGVNIRRDSQSGKLFMTDGRGENAMVVEEISADLILVQPFYLHVGDCAHLSGIKRSIETN